MCTLKSHAKERLVQFCALQKKESHIELKFECDLMALIFGYSLLIHSLQTLTLTNISLQTQFRVIAQFPSHPLFALAQHLNLIGFKVCCRARRNNQLQYEPHSSEMQGDLISQHMVSPVLKHIAHPSVSHSNICGQLSFSH